MVGRSGGPEERLVPAAGFELATVAVRGLDRDAPWRNLALPALLPVAAVRGARIVDRFRPDVVLGMAGYVMTPAVAAARWKRVPYVLHEQNVAPGLATRMFAPGAAAVCATFPGTDRRLPRARVVETGLPLRPGFEARIPACPPRRLLVTGGSQGARRLNEAVWAALEGLLARFDEVVHLTGRQGAAEGDRRRRPGYRPLAFTDEMVHLLGEADALVSRAGVGTLAEAAAVGLPLVLIPGTFGGGHQEENARALVEAGAAVRIADDALDGPTLLAKLDSLGPERWRSMAAASRAFGRRDAAARVLGVLREAVGRGARP